MIRPPFWIIVVGVFLVSGVLPAAGSVIVSEILPERYYEHSPAHAVVETIGAFAALTLSALLLVLRRYRNDFAHHLWPACALIGMGVLGILRACVVPGTAPYVWLQTLATLFGGSFFALVWLPPSAAHSGFRRQLATHLALSTLVVVVLVGLVALSARSGCQSCTAAIRPSQQRRRSVPRAGYCSSAPRVLFFCAYRERAS